MSKRGRKSAASLTVVTPLPGQRVAPPADMTAAQAATWRAVVATKPAEWFSDDSLALLAQYCRHVATADVLQRQINILEAAEELPTAQVDQLNWLLKTRDRESKMINTFARSMRLTQQSRYKSEVAETAHRRTNGAGAKKPWQV